MVLADVNQAASRQVDAHAYPLQSRPQLPSSTETTEESKDSTDAHESTLTSPGIGHAKARFTNAISQGLSIDDVMS